MHYNRSMRQLSSATSQRLVRAILGVVFVSHVALWTYGIANPDATLRFDRAAYRLRAAQSTAASQSVGELVEFTSAHTPVGDYMWQALVLWTSRGWVPAIALVQLLAHAGALVALYQLVILWSGRRRVAAIAVVFYAVLPIDFIVPHFVASEAFFNPLVIVATLFLVRYERRTRATGDLAYAGLLYSLAAMTRTELLPWLACMLALVIARLVRSEDRRTWMRRSAVVVLCTMSLQCIWVGGRALQGLPVAFGQGELTLAWHLADRSSVVEARAHGGVPPAQACTTKGSPLVHFARTATVHPAPFAREWFLQAVKFLALPDNLDGLRYLGFFEFTGNRANLVHSHGWLGAARLLFEEMPVLTSVLIASMALFGLFWLLVLRGLLEVRNARLQLWLSWVLLSLPILFLAMRVVTQGESRKRSPVDFVLVAFAALGTEALWRRRSGTQEPTLDA